MDYTIKCENICEAEYEGYGDTSDFFVKKDGKEFALDRVKEEPLEEESDEAEDNAGSSNLEFGVVNETEELKPKEPSEPGSNDASRSQPTPPPLSDRQLRPRRHTVTAEAFTPIWPAGMQSQKKPLRRRNYTCKMCLESFRTKTARQEHECRQFRCNTCGRSFPDRGALERHNGKKHLCCIICRKRFAFQGDLKRHLLTVHTEDAPDDWEEEDRPRGNAENKSSPGAELSVTPYDKSSAVASVEKPFSCTVCGRSYADNRNLKIHMLGHAGEKPFSCPICAKSYADKRNVKRHMATIHSRGYSCNVCRVSYADKRNLAIHQLSHAVPIP